jgi:hypothetical protein
MKNFFKYTLLTTTLMAISSTAFSGTITTPTLTGSKEGLSILASTATLSSQSIAYKFGADYAVGDKITFTFSQGIASNYTFSSNPYISPAGLVLELSSSDTGTATYTVTTAPITSIDTVVDLGSVTILGTSLNAAPLTLTVSSETAAGALLDTEGTRSVTVAEVKSEFGTLTTSSVFDNVIENSEGSDSTTFTADTSDTLTWTITNPDTTSWIQTAWNVVTEITIQGEAGKMMGLAAANFSSSGTHTFDEAAGTLTISYSGKVSDDTIIFTPQEGNDAVALSAQSFKIDAKYTYFSGDYTTTTSVAAKVNGGEWTLTVPKTSTTNLTGSVTFNHHNLSATGAFCDIDEVLDPGETSLMTVTVSNMTSGSVSGLKAHISSNGDITFANDGMIEFMDIPSARQTANASLEMSLNTAVTNEQVTIRTVFMSDDPNAVLPEIIMTTVNVNNDYIKDRTIENFDSPDTVWLDWQRSNKALSQGDPSQWDITNSMITGPNLATKNDITLVSPIITVAGNGEFSINFDHAFEFETGSDLTPWDGGVIEISVDNGDWTDVIATGGVFTVGYTGTISDTNPILSGREGFVRSKSTTTSETITFADGALNGQKVQFRFRIGSDESKSAPGWTIDNVSFSNSIEPAPFSSLVTDSGICVNRSPLLFALTGPASASEKTLITLMAQGTDFDLGTPIYIWTQTAGSTPLNTWDIVQVDGEFTFEAPEVAADETYIFSVVATDGELSSPAQEVSVVIVNETQPNKSSGGSIGWLVLLLLPLGFIRRKKKCSF